MGIIRLSLVTACALGAAMSHFGTDEGLPADRIGREPAIAQETIEPVSAPLAAPAVTIEPAKEVNAAAELEPAPNLPSRFFVVTPIEVTKSSSPQTPADKAEEAARLMAAANVAVRPAPAAPVQIADRQKLAQVSANLVNMRSGPSTEFGVVGRLRRGTEVHDMGSTSKGWSEITVIATGDRGFIASKYLTPLN